MKKRHVVDVLLALVLLAIWVVLALLVDPAARTQRGFWVLWCAVALLLALLLVWAFYRCRERGGSAAAPPEPAVTGLALLNDEGERIALWDLHGKVGVVIGRDQGENQVDVDLTHSQYAGTVDIEHVVLNYSAGIWYAEGLSQRFGVSVQPGGAGQRYRLAPGQPCRLGRGDVLQVGLVRLMML